MRKKGVERRVRALVRGTQGLSLAPLPGCGNRKPDPVHGEPRPHAIGLSAGDSGAPSLPALRACRTPRNARGHNARGPDPCDCDCGDPCDPCYPCDAVTVLRPRVALMGLALVRLAHHMLDGQ